MSAFRQGAAGQGAALEFIPFEPAHLVAIEPRGAQVPEALLRDATEAQRLVVPGLAWTGLVGDRVGGCGGILPLWPGYGVCWVFAAEVRPRHWLAATLKTRAVLAAAEARGFRRIEANVRLDFAAGHRWMAQLGFAPVCPRANFVGDATYWLYERLADEAPGETP